MPIPDQIPPVEEMPEDPVNTPYGDGIISQQHLLDCLIGRLAYGFVYLWAGKALWDCKQ